MVITRFAEFSVDIPISTKDIFIIFEFSSLALSARKLSASRSTIVDTGIRLACESQNNILYVLSSNINYTNVYYCRAVFICRVTNERCTNGILDSE